MLWEVDQIVLIPMLFHLCLVLVCWAYYMIREGKSPLASAKNRIYRCQVCERVYLDARDVPLARCPRCGCLNEAVRT